MAGNRLSFHQASRIIYKLRLAFALRCLRCAFLDKRLWAVKELCDLAVIATRHSQLISDATGACPPHAPLRLSLPVHAAISADCAEHEGAARSAVPLLVDDDTYGTYDDSDCEDEAESVAEKKQKEKLEALRAKLVQNSVSHQTLREENTRLVVLAEQSTKAVEALASQGKKLKDDIEAVRMAQLLSQAGGAMGVDGVEVAKHEKKVEADGDIVTKKDFETHSSRFRQMSLVS